MSSVSRILVSAYIFEWEINMLCPFQRGKDVKSDLFYAGADNESTWQMSFYPKGSIESAIDYASVSLKMTSGSTVVVSIKLALIIGDQIIKEQNLYNLVYSENCKHCSDNFAKVTDISYPLRILCELKISEEKKTLPYIRRVNDFNQFLSDVHSLLSKQKETDVVIITRDKKEFNAHKSVLAARSEVFAAKLQSSMSENLEVKLEIDDMDGSDVEEFLQYVYSGNLTKWSLPLCMNLFVAGEKYKINTLKNTCSLYLQQNISVEVSANILVLADVHGDECLKEVALDFISSHAKEVLPTHGWETMVREKQHLVDKVILRMARCRMAQ